MALRQVRVDDDPILRKTSKVVKEITDKEIELLDDMYDTMESSDGVGIAAVQVGVLKRMVLVSIPDANAPEDEWVTIEMINPEILEKSSDTQICMEGCLSVPGKQGEVTRPKKVKVKYFDREMNEHIEEFDSFGAVVCSHEIDHLDGILYTDKAMNLEDIPTEE